MRLRVKCFGLLSFGIKFAVLLILTIKFAGPLYAQHKDSTLLGTLKGKVKDSIYNFMLTSATVAVYNKADSNLLRYSIPNNFGEFTISSLPLEVPLKLVITHVGYKAFYMTLIISRPGNLLDVGQLYMYQLNEKDSLQTAQEVIVTAVAPVRMKGDTLEFNASAFKLENNATTEDLIRRLPGFTIWGDGEITFNGKKINSVLVDGKPFMGSSDITIATQNLPKDAISKIQVYQQVDQKNPLDSTLHANIKLKEDKKMGYFGKVSAGYGTGQHYAMDGMMSGFNKKAQLSAIAAANNVNKMAGDVNALLKKSSFKGEGANMDYQTDFTIYGLNKQLAAGAKYQYDFIENPEYRKTSRLNADCFVRNNNATIENNIKTNTFLAADSVLQQISNTNRFNSSSMQRFAGNYERSSKIFMLNTTFDVTLNHQKSTSETNAQQERTGTGIVSNSSSGNEEVNNGRDINAGAMFKNMKGYYSTHRIPNVFSVEYRFSNSNNDGHSRNRSSFTSLIDPSANQTFDRLYAKKDANTNTHTLNYNYPMLRSLIFGNARLGGIDLGISGVVSVINSKDSNTVFDMDTAKGDFKMNNYLSNQRNSTTKNFVPALQISKQFYKGLTNRYNKYVTIALNIKNQYYSMNNEATHYSQNFAYRYSRFVPDASFNYNNHQYGNYEAAYELKFATDVKYPGINEIAPLIDSANLWFIPLGNPSIKPEYNKTLSALYRFTSRKPKNPWNVLLNVAIGATDRKIVNSIVYDETGKQISYPLNMNGYKYSSGNIAYSKSLEIKKSTLELHADYSLTIDESPQLINNAFNVSKSKNHRSNASIAYRYKEMVTLKVEETVSFYHSKQEGFNNSFFKSANQFTRFIAVLHLPKNLEWNTNITYNKSSSNGMASQYFTIWNASASYRFLKGNNGEVKFSALDLLRQNRGITNTNYGNMQTFTVSNVLQQYFMITLSYYPRKFGKKQKDDN